MKKYAFLLGALVLCACLGVAAASAQRTGLQFRGQFLDGPFAGKRVLANCAVDLTGDRLKQQGPCDLAFFTPASRGERNPFRVVDPEARVEVVGGGYLLRIIMGVGVLPTDDKGNFKNSLFEALVSFAEPIALHDGRTVVIGGLFRPTAANVTLGGFSTTGSPRGVSNPDCLIFDIVGPDV